MRIITLTSRLAWGLALTLCVAMGPLSVKLFPQGQGNPFIDHSDTGETIHVLPGPAAVHSPRDTSPTFAPINRAGLYPASYGSGDLKNHGGKIINGAQYYAIYWNSSVASSTATGVSGATIQDRIRGFVQNFSGNADYTIVQQYTGSNGSIQATIPLAAEFVDSKSAQSSIKDSAIQTYLVSLFKNSSTGVIADSNAIYGIYFPPGMRVQLTGGMSCSSFCGYHSHFTYNGMQIKYAVYPYLNCSGCSLGGLTVADMLTIVSSHEIREAVTDPGDNNVNAWYDGSGYEADDKCVWHNLYQMQQGSFWVQPEYSNQDKLPGSTVGSCVVP